jgi:hypothetical protein
MIQTEEPDYYIKVGIKNNKVVNIDWTGMPDTEDLILWKVIGLLNSAIKMIDLRNNNSHEPESKGIKSKEL